MDANRFVRKIQKPSVILGGVIAIAVVLRVAILDRWSLWLDEIYTVRFRGTANLQTVLYDPYDPHPPLYFLLVKGWTYLFGTDPTVVRSLSLIFSVASVLCIYFLTRRIYDRWTGLLASTLFAIVPVHIHFGEIARMYSLLVFLTIISTYFYVRLWERRTGITVLYVLTTSALMYTHVYGIFVVAGQFLHYLLEVKTRDGKPGWKRGVLIYVSIGLIYLPWGIVLSSQVFDLFTPSTGQSPSVGWIPKPSFKLVIDAFETFVGKPWLNPVSAGSNLTYRLVQLNLVIYLIALGNSLTTYDTEDWDMNYKSLLTITFLTPIVLPLIFSVFFKPIFYPRFVLPATVPLTVMVAHGLRAIPYRYTDYGFVAVLIVSSLILTASYYQGETVDPWQESTRFLEQYTDGSDVVVTQPAYIIGDAEYLQFYYDENASLIGTEPGGTDVEGWKQRRIDRTLENGHRACVFQYQSDKPVGRDRLFNQTPVKQYGSYRKGKITVKCFERG